MSKPTIRTASLILDDVQRMINLFGSIANTYRILGFQPSEVSYAQLYRAMHYQTVTPAQKQLIEEAWERWRFLYLRPEVPESADLTLDPFNRDVAPAWHPEGELEDDDEDKT